MLGVPSSIPDRVYIYLLVYLLLSVGRTLPTPVINKYLKKKKMYMRYIVFIVPGIGELELISDAHFMGVAPIDVDPANISFFQTRFLDALISNYASLTSLKVYRIIIYDNIFTL